jgi:hypothetical protein
MKLDDVDSGELIVGESNRLAPLQEHGRSFPVVL